LEANQRHRSLISIPKDKMKKLLIALSLALVSQFIPADEPPKETKRICVDVKDKEGKEVIDPKTKKVKQNCKEVKQHKKLEGTDVPVKK
jgi:hypothetical protein